MEECLAIMTVHVEDVAKVSRKLPNSWETVHGWAMTDRRFEFGPFVFDGLRRLLLKDGSPAPVGQRGLALLDALLAAEGRPISKSELIEAAWASPNVEESNLTVQIAALRKVLGKASDGSEWIATVQRFGYRFCLPADRDRTDARNAAMPNLAGDGAASIAVLPFLNLSQEADQQHLAEGLAEDIRTELSRFRQIRVLPASGARANPAGGLDIAGVGRDLGVRYLVTGSLRRLDTRIRLAVQLIDAPSSQHVWAEKLDIGPDDFVTRQDEMVRTIVATLTGRLLAADTAIARRRPPASLAAYECVLRADALPQVDPSVLAEARRLYEQAISLDPHYARAYALLSINVQIEWELDLEAPDTLLDRALDLARKSADLDDDDCVCHSALCVIYWARRSFELAEEHGLKALDLNPNRPAQHASLGFIYTYTGRLDMGFDCFARARAIDPYFEPSWYWMGLAMAQFLATRYQDALLSATRVLTSSYWQHAFLAACHAQLGNEPKARHHCTETLGLAPNFTIAKRMAREPFKHAGDRQKLAAALRRAGFPE